MNHCDLPTDLQAGLEPWLPPGYHVYVIAVQRCRLLYKLRNAIHELLGKAEEGHTAARACSVIKGCVA